MPYRHYFLVTEGLLFFLIINPFFLLMLGTSFDSYDLQRLTQLLLLLVTTVHFLSDSTLRAYALQYLENWLSYRKLLLGLVFVLGLISAVHARYPLFALTQVATFFLLFLLALGVAGFTACQTENFTEWTLSFILLCFGLVTFTAIGLFFIRDASVGLTLDPNAFINLVTAPGYMNRRFFDDAVVFAIPLLTGFFFLTASNSKKALIFCLLSFLFARGILGGSRIYVYEPLALLVLLPIIFRKRAIPYLLILACSLLCGFLLYEVMYHSIFNIQQSADGRFSLTDPNHRILLWQLAIDMIKAHPWLGVGPGHYPVYAFNTENYAAHPHDFLLALASEWGIPASMIMLLLTGTAYCAMLKKALTLEKADRPIVKTLAGSQNTTPCLAMGLMGAITGAGLMASVDGLILMPPGQIMLALTLGLSIAGHPGSIKPELLQLSSKRFNFGIIGLSLLAWLAIGLTVLPTVMLLPDFVAQYLEKCQFICTLSPNYWSQGFIQLY